MSARPCIANFASAFVDLAVCEALALGVLSEAGIAAAETNVIDVGSRRYLESVRFDHLPMSLAPRPGGILPPLPGRAPTPVVKLLDVWDEAARLGRRFWARVAEDGRVTDEFRRSAALLA